MNQYEPNFEEECQICGTSPTVRVKFHIQPETRLCGSCFFADAKMHDWQEWNDQGDQDVQ